jgi:hypothetical protein
LTTRSIRSEDGPTKMQIGVSVPAFGAQQTIHSGRYWRIRTTVGSQSYQEVIFREAVGGARRLGGTAMASSGNAANAFDGNPQTIWQHLNSSGSTWIGYDFVVPVAISEIVRLAGTTTTGWISPITVFIEYSSDNVNWNISWTETEYTSWLHVLGESRTATSPHAPRISSISAATPERSVSTTWGEVSTIFEANPVTGQAWTRDEVERMHITLKSR